MTQRLNTIFQQKGVNLTKKEEWGVTLRESCFRIILSAEKSENSAKVFLNVVPDSKEGYEILINYQLDVGQSSEFIERDKWRDAEEVLTIQTDNLVFDVLLKVYVLEILAPQNLTASTSFRNFHVLTSEMGFYVNAGQLKALGGKLFKEWYEKECGGEDTVVVQSMDAKDLELLLNACCAYSTTTIHRRNFLPLLEIAEEYKIIGLLRCLEMFLIQCESIHKIRKLEFSAEYRMARLADLVLRSYKSKVDRIESLYNYLAENNESIDDVHPDILEMFEIFPAHIVL